MSKKLNIDSITNELEGSAFFPQKKVIPDSPTPSTAITKPSLEKDASTTENQTQPVPYPSTPVPRTTVPLARRKIKQRHPFDIYQDQYDELKRISFEEVARGGIGSMSSMVREAIDMYLTKKKGQ